MPSSTVAHLDELLHHKGWLLEQLAENAGAYLAMLERLKTLPPESDTHAALFGTALRASGPARAGRRATL